MKFSKKGSFAHLLFLALTIPGILNAQEINFIVLNSKQDWDSAKTIAAETGRDLFMDIYATWCGPCKMMDRDVYTDSTVAEFYNDNYVNLKVDGESSFGSQLAMQYNLNAYPSMYFIKSDEELIHEVIGYRESEALINQGKLVQESGLRYLELKNAYQTRELSAPELSEFTGLLESFDDRILLSRLAVDLVSKLTEDDFLKPENKDLLIKAGGDINSPAVKTIISNAITIKESWGQEDFYAYISEVFNLTMQRAIEAMDAELMERIANEIIPVYMMDVSDRIPEGVHNTRKIYYSQVRDWDKYIEFVEKYYREYGNGDTGILYDEVYYIVENQLFDDKVLERAIEWMNTVITAKPEFENFFLMSLVYTYKQEYDNARIWVGKSEELVKTQDQTDSLNELKNYLENL